MSGNKDVSLPNQPDEKWLQQLVDNQAKELELRSRELDLQKQQDSNNLDFAKESLAAQERDRKHARECERDKQKDRYWLVGAIVAALLLVVAVAVWKDKDQLAMEIVKAVAYLTAGAAGGYAAGRLRPTSNGQRVEQGD